MTAFKKYLIVFFLLTFVLSNSCSVLGIRRASPALKATLAGLAGRYLAAVAAGNEKSMKTMVAFDTLLKKGTPQALSAEEFAKQLRALQNRWTKEENPLLGLQIIEIDVHENEADVRLRKKDRPDYPIIWVHLIWSGTGWIIAEDNIFGRDKLAGKTLETGTFK